MEVIWHGTAAIELRCNEGRLLFDPFVPRPGAGLPVTLADFDGCRDIFVTHGHFDHIADIPALCRRDPAVRVHCSAAPRATLRRRGVAAERLDLIGPEQELSCQGFTLRTLAGRHAVLPALDGERLRYMLRSPARADLPHLLWQHLHCREAGETLFYSLEAEGRCLFLLGSLNLRPDVDYPTGCDLLILPYNGWADNLPPAQEVIRRLQPRRVVLDHYDDSFPPLTRPLDLSPLLRLYPDLVTPLRLGQTLTL